jgi:uncharacterized protein
MSGEQDLKTLRSRMSPRLHGEPYVYCCATDGQVPAGLQPVGTFREAEGLTLIVSRDQAKDAGLRYQFECALVTLEVHSSLEAVGFIASISEALAQERIPCNVVSAFFHDHLFVPFEQRDRVMQVLQELAAAG